MLPSTHRLKVGVGAPPPTPSISRDGAGEYARFVGEPSDALGRKEPKKKTPDRRVDVETTDAGWFWLCCLKCFSEPLCC